MKSVSAVLCEIPICKFPDEVPYTDHTGTCDILIYLSDRSIRTIYLVTVLTEINDKKISTGAVSVLKFIKLYMNITKLPISTMYTVAFIVENVLLNAR